MQNQKNLISGLVVLAIVIVGGYFIYTSKHQASAPVVGNVPTGEEEAPVVNNPTTTPAVNPAPTPAPVAKIGAWDVFQQYLGYLKNHDVGGVNSVISEKSPSYGKPCPMRQGTAGKECNDFMDNSYQGGIKLTKAQFVNVWEDSNQVVLSTNATIAPALSTDKPNSENWQKYFLFFTKDKNGTPKFLVSYHITTNFEYDDPSAATPASKAKRVADNFLDVDKDGLLDKHENCTTKSANPSPYNANCSSTSSAKRDSLGDGFWDGVRVYFAQK